MKISIVDDDVDLVGAMTAILESAGHGVSSEAAGATAISHIIRRRPDCVLTDLMMAELNGLELCRELREKPELTDLKVIVMSAQVSDHWKDKAREAGAARYYVKPVDASAVAAEVERLVARAEED